MKKLLLICTLLSMSFVHANTEDKKPNKDGKYTFTKEEFKKAVYAELEKKMKKIGRSRLLEFSKELLTKEEMLAAKEKKLVKREEQISLSSETLKKRFVEFKATQEKFLSCLDKEDQEADRRVTHMVSVVSGMRPQTASNLLSTQDPELAVKILGMLEANKVAKIFNLMDKEISAKLQRQFMTMKK